MKPGYLLCDDLIFISRIAGTARSLGLEVRSVRSMQDLLKKAEQEPPACVLIDLHNATLEPETLVAEMRKLGKTFLVGYGSHVDTATLKKAREAGFDVVWPRSKFVDELAQELPRWYEAGD